MRVTIMIFLALLFSSVSAQTRDCDDAAAAKELMSGPPQSRYEYRSRYTNQAYKYSVTIPNNLTAYDGRDQLRHNGFVLPLASESVIFVSGDPNSAEYNTPREAATREVEFLRQRGKKIESETITDSHLGTLDAVLLVVTYTCPGSSDRRIESSVMALSADKEFIYELVMYSPADRYENDRAVLDQIMKSWKITQRG